MKNEYLKWLKIGLYTLATVVSVFIIMQSKKFFDNNYNKHEILESDADLYKVENNENPTQDQNNTIPAQIIEQQPVEIHTEVTDIVTGSDATTPNLTSTPAPQEGKNTPIVINTKPIEESSAKNEPKKSDTRESKIVKKVEKKKDVKKDKQIQKPKTLEKKESVSKSVMKNPLFQSYVVQVGAFSNITEAKKYQLQISGIQSVSTFRTELSSVKNLHKVFIGYFETHQAAENICIKLKEENVQCFVTKL